MADLKEKKFGFVVQKHHPHCHPCPPPFPGSIPPGINMQDWINYINSYIDVRARQMYEKLKKLVPEGGGTGGGVQSVTYVENPGLDDQFEIGKLKVDGTPTSIHVPVIGLEAVDRDEFTNPKRILTINGVGDNGEDVEVFCEEPEQVEPFNPDGYVYDEILLRDQNDNQTVYKVYIKDGTLESARKEQE